MCELTTYVQCDLFFDCISTDYSVRSIDVSNGLIVCFVLVGFKKKVLWKGKSRALLLVPCYTSPSYMSPAQDMIKLMGQNRVQISVIFQPSSSFVRSS